MYATRPSARELTKVLQAAKVALEEGNGAFANFVKASSELEELDVADHASFWKLIRAALEEITIDDYAGSKPPQKSYEKKIEDCELFAFCWRSTIFQKQMYIKFAVEKKWYFHVSLHETRFREEG